MMDRYMTQHRRNIVLEGRRGYVIVICADLMRFDFLPFSDPFVFFYNNPKTKRLI